MTTVDTPSRWLTVTQAARYLSLSVQTIRRLIHAGDLPASRVGPVEIRIHADDLDEHLRSRRVDGPSPVRDGRRHGGRPGRRAAQV